MVMAVWRCMTSNWVYVIHGWKNVALSNYADSLTAGESNSTQKIYSWILATNCQLIGYFMAKRRANYLLSISSKCAWRSNPCRTLPHIWYSHWQPGWYLYRSYSHWTVVDKLSSASVYLTEWSTLIGISDSLPAVEYPASDYVDGDILWFIPKSLKPCFDAPPPWTGHSRMKVIHPKCQRLSLFIFGKTCDC
jgi:hypothetical protein